MPCSSVDTWLVNVELKRLFLAVKIDTNSSVLSFPSTRACRIIKQTHCCILTDTDHVQQAHWALSEQLAFNTCLLFSWLQQRHCVALLFFYYYLNSGKCTTPNACSMSSALSGLPTTSTSWAGRTKWTSDCGKQMQRRSLVWWVSFTLWYYSIVHHNSWFSLTGSVRPVVLFYELAASFDAAVPGATAPLLPKVLMDADLGWNHSQ